MEQSTRWTVIVLCLMFIWCSIVILFYLKADEVTRDPCSICAERMGNTVMCTQINTSFGITPATIYYYNNGSVYVPGSESTKEYNLINISNIN